MGWEPANVAPQPASQQPRIRVQQRCGFLRCSCSVVRKGVALTLFGGREIFAVAHCCRSGDCQMLRNKKYEMPCTGLKTGKPVSGRGRLPASHKYFAVVHPLACLVSFSVCGYVMRCVVTFVWLRARRLALRLRWRFFSRFKTKWSVKVVGKKLWRSLGSSSSPFWRS